MTILVALPFTFNMGLILTLAAIAVAAIIGVLVLRRKTAQDKKSNQTEDVLKEIAEKTKMLTAKNTFPLKFYVWEIDGPTNMGTAIQDMIFTAGLKYTANDQEENAVTIITRKAASIGYNTEMVGVSSKYRTTQLSNFPVEADQCYENCMNTALDLLLSTIHHAEQLLKTSPSTNKVTA